MGTTFLQYMHHYSFPLVVPSSFTWCSTLHGVSCCITSKQILKVSDSLNVSKLKSWAVGQEIVHGMFPILNSLLLEYKINCTARRCTICHVSILQKYILLPLVTEPLCHCIIENSEMLFCSIRLDSTWILCAEVQLPASKQPRMLCTNRLLQHFSVAIGWWRSVIKPNKLSSEQLVPHCWLSLFRAVCYGSTE